MIPKTLPSVAAGLLLAILPGSSSPAQESAPLANFDELVQVEEVLLDVLAVDDDGEIVRGLGIDDFVIEENGQPVTLTSVGFYTSFYEGGSPTSPSGEDVSGIETSSDTPAAQHNAAQHNRVSLGGAGEAGEEIPASRYFVLFFHDPITGGSIGQYRRRQQQKAQRGALEWVESHLAPSDWVAVASYDTRLKIHQDFTQDRIDLGNAILGATKRRDPDKDVGRRGRPLPPIGSPSLLRHMPKGFTGKDDLRKKSRSFYDGLRLLAEASGYIVGRKNVVLFSTGFGELDPFTLLAEPDPRRYPRMERALNEYNLAVYSVDLTPRRIRHYQDQPMIRLSLATGGRYFRDPSNYVDPLDRISNETRGYYLISYQSEHPAAESGFQRVKVKAKDENIRIRTRTGYRYGPAPDQARK